MEDTGCDNDLINEYQYKRCFKAFKIQSQVLMETQHFLTEVFPIPFQPEYQTLVKEFISKVDKNTKKTSMETLFAKWNIFAPHVK